MGGIGPISDYDNWKLQSSEDEPRCCERCGRPVDTDSNLCADCEEEDEDL